MHCICLRGILGILIAIGGQYPSENSYVIDTVRSHVEIGVYREGLLKVFGHDHVIEARRVSGAVHFNAASVEMSAITLSLESNALVVADPGASDKERHDVQTTMEGSQVLNVAAFPRITFRSTAVSGLKKAGEWLAITLKGELSLHGVQKLITIPVRIRFEDGRLHALGEVLLAQTDFGITPIRIAGGVVRVKDRVKVSFDVVAVKGMP